MPYLWYIPGMYCRKYYAIMVKREFGFVKGKPKYSTYFLHTFLDESYKPHNQILLNT